MAKKTMEWTEDRAQFLLDNIEPRGSVTIITPQGNEWTGKVVMRSSHGGWVLNMGGQHGTPGLVDVNNIVTIGRSSFKLVNQPVVKRK